VSLANKWLCHNEQAGNVILLGIAFAVISFNLIAVFGLDSLLHDDPAMYRRVLSGRFPHGLVKFNLIAPFSEWLGWNIMAISPHLARGLYVLLLLVPLSCCFYHLWHRRFGFSRMTSFAAAVLPNILPMQWQIPAGINMSYVLWGLLFAILSLILGMRYLEKSHPGHWLTLAAASCCFLVATQIMEQALFLFPPFFLAFWGYKKFARENRRLLAAFSIIALVKLAQMLVYQRKAAHLIPLEEIADRFGAFLQWVMPVADVPPLCAALIFFSTIAAGFALQMRDRRGAWEGGSVFSRFTDRGQVIFFHGFFVFWILSTALPAILLSFFFSIRYATMSLFGASAIFVFSLQGMIEKLLPGRGKKAWLPVFSLIIIVSGISRFFYLEKVFALENANQAVIVRGLAERNLPVGSQIVIVGIQGRGYKGFDGGWERSSGYLQFALKRKDLKGLIGPRHASEYYNFDDHFNRQLRGWWPRNYMTGLSLRTPVFLFCHAGGKRGLEQLEYALQWRGENCRASWTIYRFDKASGKSLPVVSGDGMKEYMTAIRQLKKIGVAQSDILWGGPPTEEERIRLKKGTKNGC